MAFIYKWRWRFLTNKNAIWANIIKAIHGPIQGNNLPVKSSNAGLWVSIVKCISEIHESQIIPVNSMSLQLDSNVADRFTPNGWIWFWRRALRGGAEYSQFIDLSSLLANVFLSDYPDLWCWAENPSHNYSVSSARLLIDKQYLAPSSRATSWCRYVPIKINVFIWRLNLLCLPTKINLMLRGVEMENTTCCLCNLSDEDEVHLFMSCETSLQIWHRIGRWINYDIPSWSSIEDAWLWVDGVPISGNQRIILRIITISFFWNVWHLRNSYVFNDAKFKRSYVFDSIVVTAFEWFYY
ncbi:uncharacterized protein [Rutidosis leptorrhynchoides]|uniref:uncharacterized protein n=1 Tax=Rutidosis leptorrhynchoides TaxID=125765 RepID=UPI003A9A53D7